MKALVFDENVKLVEAPQPERKLKEALIRVRMAGICNTDLEIVKGYMNFKGILGHEFAGEVVQADKTHWIGKRVVGAINIGCGSCSQCVSGWERHCAQRQVLGISQKQGAFAEYLTLPLQNLIEVPDSVSDEAAVFVEPLAAACRILEQVDIQPDHRAAVIGDGKLGQLIARVLHIHGCRLTVFGKHVSKLELIRSLKIGVKNISEKSDKPFDIVIEASGSTSGIAAALEMIKPQGTIILKSTTHDPSMIPMSKIVVDEIQIMGSRCGLFKPAMQLLEKELVDVQPLISKTFKLSDGIKAMQFARETAFKVLLDMR